MGETYLSRSGLFAWDRVHWADGFVFCGPFDAFLRQLSEDHLADVWAGLAACLRSHGLDPDLLTWGGGHPAYTGSYGPVDASSPLGFFGWVMPTRPVVRDSVLWRWDPPGHTALGEMIEADLRRLSVPVTVATARIRGYACRRVVDGVALAPIPPGDVTTGLDLVVEHCVDSSPDWSLGEYNPWAPEHACGRVARAIATRDSEAFLAALEEARDTFTRAGYRIAVLGYADNLLSWPPDDTLGIVPRAPVPPIVVELGEGLRVELDLNVTRPAGWARVIVRSEDAGDRYGYGQFHRDRLANFGRDLCAVLADAAVQAVLISLGEAAEIVARRGSIHWRFPAAHGGEDAFEQTAAVGDDDLSALADALERCAVESLAREPHADPVPAWGFSGPPQTREQLAQLMAHLTGRPPPVED